MVVWVDEVVDRATEVGAEVVEEVEDGMDEVEGGRVDKVDIEGGGGDDGGTGAFILNLVGSSDCQVGECWV